MAGHRMTVRGRPQASRRNSPPRLAERLDWHLQALCPQVDYTMFFPAKGSSAEDAKNTCARCPVRAPCLQYALDNDERYGVWGGVSERGRRRIKAARRAGR